MRNVPVITILLTGVITVALESVPTSLSADSSEFDNYTATCADHLVQLQQALETKFHLSSYKHYGWSQPNNQLLLSTNGQVKVIATIQFVGDVSHISHTWLWAWANPSVLPSMRNEVRKVKAFGERNKFSKLTKDEWRADDSDGWDMTAIAATVLHAKGAYRSPGKNGDEFMVITDIHWAKKH